MTSNLRNILGGMTLGAVCAFGVTQVVSSNAQDRGRDHAGHDHGEASGMHSMDDMAEVMQDWMAAMKPGPAHETLGHSIGEWDTVTRMWWEGPNGPPIETRGTAKFEWVLDKRFVMHRQQSLMPLPDFSSGHMEMKMVPWEGMGMTGYDNVRNMYVGTWCDSMSTHILTMKGTADSSGKKFTMYGEMDEPMMNMYGRLVKYVTTVSSNDLFKFEIYDLAAGDDYKVIEVTYSRKKKS